MTLMQMIQQGAVWHLVGMGAIFGLMVFLLNAIGGKLVAPKDQPQKSYDMPAVTAAISAAVNEYRKNK